jgi:hypothetical protein
MKKYRQEEITPELLISLPYDELSPEEVKEIFLFADANFTPENLKRFSELLEEGVPADKVLAEMEEMQKQFDSAKAK